MSTVPATKFHVAHAVLVVGIFLAIPLWREFNEDGEPLWNAFLVILLVGLVAGAFFGVRYLHKNSIEVGEARFTSSDTDR